MATVFRGAAYSDTIRANRESALCMEIERSISAAGPLDCCPGSCRCLVSARFEDVFQQHDRHNGADLSVSDFRLCRRCARWIATSRRPAASASNFPTRSSYPISVLQALPTTCPEDFDIEETSSFGLDSAANSDCLPAADLADAVQDTAMSASPGAITVHPRTCAARPCRDSSMPLLRQQAILV